MEQFTGYDHDNIRHTFQKTQHDKKHKDKKYRDKIDRFIEIKNIEMILIDLLK
jgi:hypothetical protein